MTWFVCTLGVARAAPMPRPKVGPVFSEIGGLLTFTAGMPLAEIHRINVFRWRHPFLQIRKVAAE